MKRCSLCGETKSKNDFYRAKGKKDGLSSQCKTCLKLYHQRPEAKKSHADACKKYQQTEKGKASSRKGCSLFRKTDAFKKSIQKYRDANPERRAAQTAIWNALKSGHIHRPNSCSVCGVDCIPEGHHYDYSKPLDVIWVCKACHTDYHWSKT